MFTTATFKLRTCDLRRVDETKLALRIDDVFVPLVVAAPAGLLPVRIVAILALISVVVAFVHVLRHLRSIERTMVADDLVPRQRGPRNNVVLIICAVPIIVVTLLLYLIIKT